MKILVCVDGSEQSFKALEKAAVIARGCQSDEVAVIYVDDGKHNIFLSIDRNKDYLDDDDIREIKQLQQEHKERREAILSDALKALEKHNITARPILKVGHPARVIVDVAHTDGFDLIVIGNRGLGGLRRVILGSVSNAVVQEVKNCSVLTVK